jgi:transaldolase/glucose-6-phosphate isomerase
VIQAIEEAGVPLGPVSGRLLDEGVRLFAEAYDRLLAAVSRAREAA